MRLERQSKRKEDFHQNEAKKWRNACQVWVERKLILTLFSAKTWKIKLIVILIRDTGIKSQVCQLEILSFLSIYH